MKMVASTRYIAAFGIALIVCTTALGSRVQASEAFVLPAPYARAVCTFGIEKYGAIGLSLTGADIPGLNGTEVKQIYRVFYKTELNGKMTTGFAGWISVTFDKHFWFGISSELSKNDVIMNRILSVRSGDPSKLPLASWLEQLSRLGKPASGSVMLRLMNAKKIYTAISPCFSRSWDGKN